MPAPPTRLIGTLLAASACFSCSGPIEQGPSATLPPPPAPAPTVEAEAPSIVRGAAPIGTYPSAVCAVLQGQVVCWGDDADRYVGRGLPSPILKPTVIAGTKGAIALQIDPLLRGMWVLLDDGKIQMRTERGADTVPGLDGVVDFAARRGQLCAVLRGGALKCVTPAFPDRAVPVPPLTNVSAIAAALDAFCAIHDGGALTCWGNPPDSRGGTNLGERVGGSRFALTDERGAAEEVRDAIHVSMQIGNVCIVRRAGQVACWHTRAEETELRRTPYKIALKDPAKRVRVSSGGTCAVLDAGALACWSEGRDGPTSPVLVPSISDVADVLAADGFGCALRASGEVACWGKNPRGQLGRGYAGDLPAPRAVDGVRDATSVAVADSLSCALTKGGEVLCWGKGTRSGKPVAEGPRRFAPVLVPGVTEVTRLTSDGNDVLAQTSKGQVFTIGAWDPASSRYEVSAPEKLGPIAALVSYGAGLPAFPPLSPGAALLKSGGAAYVLSHDGPLQTLSLPKLSDVVSVAAWGDSVCAARKSGDVACFVLGGSNGAAAPKVLPAPAIKGVKDAKAILGNDNFYWVLRKTGDVSVFLAPGVPAGDPMAAPIEANLFEGLTGVASFASAAGSYATCALLATKKIACWGTNSSGERGAGNYDSSQTATEVVNLSDVVSVATARRHACAVTEDGRVSCWGTNELDQCGDPRPFVDPAPAPIAFP